MSSSKGCVETEVEKHGTAVEGDKQRVKCNYCEKEVRGFYRLKHHLGGVGSDVLPCPVVPLKIKTAMRDSLLDKKKERLRKEVDQLFHPDLPLKRVLSPSSASASASPPLPPTKRAHYSQSSSAPNPNPKKGIATQTAGHNDNDDRSEPVPARHEECVEGGAMVNQNVAKAVGGFFLGAGIDPGMVKLPSFKNMIDVVINCGGAPHGFSNIPSTDYITGRILQEEVREIKGRINDMRECWKESGCTVLLDSWVDQAGRSLIGFLVQCVKGVVFLRSIDATDAVEDVDQLFVLLSQVIREVGVGSVVQVIMTDVTPHMQATGQRLTDKFSVHCNLCADFCIDLILSKIAEMDHVTQVLITARSMTRFIYSNEGPMQILHKHLNGANLLRPSHWRHVAQFLTLGNIASNRDNLIEMFNSPEWTSVEGAYGPNTRRTIEEVKRDAFWIVASNVVKVTNPLVGVLDQIFGEGKTPMGCLYNAMDCAKEAIRLGLGGEEDVCAPYWDVIDDIWDNYLHTSIHAAGYYLNPGLFYADDFDADGEVVNGLHDCNLQMARDLPESKQISRQLDAYKMHSGVFSDFAATMQAKTVPPVRWWKVNGGQCRELQQFAVRVLSQPVCGASRYRPDHRLSEELHSCKGTIANKQVLRDREFVRNNRILLELSGMAEGSTSSIITEDSMMNSLGDWLSG